MFIMFMTSALFVGLLYVFTNQNDHFTSLEFCSLTHTRLLKGLAIFLVVINHIGAKSGYRYFQPLGGIGVSLFLVCSGYGLMKSYHHQGFSHYFLKRFWKVIVPYWIVFLLFSILVQPQLELISVLKGMFLVKVIGVFWYIQYAVLYYFLFYIAFTIFKDKKSIILLLLLSCVVFLLNRNLLLGEQAFAFVSGITLAQIKGEIKHKKALILSVLLLSVSMLNLLLKQSEWFRLSQYWVLNLNGAMIKTCGALGLLYLVYAKSNLKFWQIFKLPGKYSLEIYLVHVSFVELVFDEFSLVYILLLLALSISGIVLLSGLMNLLSRKLAALKCMVNP